MAKKKRPKIGTLMKNIIINQIIFRSLRKNNKKPSYEGLYVMSVGLLALKVCK